MNSQTRTGTHELVREGQTFAGASLAKRYASFVKLPHTLFALPFAGSTLRIMTVTEGARVQQ